MQPNEIIHSVLNYFGRYREKFSGRMDKEDYYIIIPPSDEDNHNSEIVYGNCMDVLAYAIEEHKLFGDWVGSSPNQVDNPNNAKIRPITKGEKLKGLEVIVGDLSDGRMTVEVTRAKRQECLDPLRTKEGYKTALGVLIYNPDLDRQAEDLWR